MAVARRGRPARGGGGGGLGARPPDGRGQVRVGGGACELRKHARRLEVSEGRWPRRGAGSERTSPLPTCAVPGTAQVEVAHLGSGSRTQGDLGQVAATLWASVSLSIRWGGGWDEKSRSSGAAQEPQDSPTPGSYSQGLRGSFSPLAPIRKPIGD